MFINLERPAKTRIGWGSDEGSGVTYTVSPSKGLGFEGELHLTTDKNGEAYLEWCKGSIAQGYGKKISLKELFELLEQRSQSD